MTRNNAIDIFKVLRLGERIEAILQLLEGFSVSSKSNTTHTHTHAQTHAKTDTHAQQEKMLELKNAVP